MQRQFRPLLFAAAGLLAAGCAHVATTKERVESFAPYATTRVGGQPVRSFLLARVGGLIGGAEVKPEKGPDGNLTEIQLQVKDPNRLGFGVATAIDRRGYWLTAGHCVTRDPVHIVVFGPDQVTRIEKVRVVWRGDADKHEPDLAILHVEHAIDRALEWSTDFKPGDAALAVGLNYDTPLHFDTGCAAGKITRVDRRSEPSPAHELIYHQAPLHAGDSGGPLTSGDGKLIGINTGAGSLRIWPFSWTVARAERPDLKWLRERIEEDVARSPSAAH